MTPLEVWLFVAGMILGVVLGRSAARADRLKFGVSAMKQSKWERAGSHAPLQTHTREAPQVFSTQLVNLQAGLTLWESLGVRAAQPAGRQYVAVKR